MYLSLAEAIQDAERQGKSLAEVALAIESRDQGRPIEEIRHALGRALAVMRGVAFVIGSLVIALTAYSAIVERRREYGIVKAIGADRRRLVSLAVQQSLIVSALGLVAGGLLFLGGRAFITSVRPQFIILATPGSVSRAVIAAVLMGLVASVLPARRLAGLEPATAYRGG